MKEGGGGDHVSVGVRKPRSKRIRPVSKRDIFVRPPGMWRFIIDNIFINYFDAFLCLSGRRQVRPRPRPRPRPGMNKCTYAIEKYSLLLLHLKR